MKERWMMEEYLEEWEVTGDYDGRMEGEKNRLGEEDLAGVDAKLTDLRFWELNLFPSLPFHKPPDNVVQRSLLHHPLHRHRHHLRLQRPNPNPKFCATLLGPQTEQRNSIQWRRFQIERGEIMKWNEMKFERNWIMVLGFCFIWVRRVAFEAREWRVTKRGAC